ACSHRDGAPPSAFCPRSTSVQDFLIGTGEHGASHPVRAADPERSCCGAQRRAGRYDIVDEHHRIAADTVGAKPERALGIGATGCTAERPLRGAIARAHETLL